MSLEQRISPLIPNQFPAFYNEDGPNFIAFVKAYYEWMEQTGGPIYESRTLLEKLDIDTTVDEFATLFKNAYLSGLPSTDIADQAFTIKHIQDLYKSRGSDEGDKLFFKLIYNREAEVYKPGVDVLRASDGKWTIPIYLEIEYAEGNGKFVGLKITGATSKSTAIVESVARRKVGSRLIDVMYLSAIRGNFQVGEYITTTGNLINAPKIIGSLTSASITDGGFGIANGDVFDVAGTNGVFGEALVSSTINGSGLVQFSLIDGGSGFSNNTNVTVSNTVIFTGGAVFNNTNFTVAETVVQNNFVFSSANSAIANGSLVIAYDGANTLLGNGSIYSTNSTAISVSARSGSLTLTQKLVLASNPLVSSNVASVLSYSTANAIVMTTNSTAVGLINSHGTFVRGGYARGSVSNCLANLTRVSKGSNATFRIDSISNTEVVANTSIGSILSLGSINPGDGNYDTPPMITIVEPTISAGSKYDWIAGIAGISGLFLSNQSAKAASGTSSTIRNANATHLELRRKFYSESLANNQQIVSYFANGVVSGIAQITSVIDDTRYLMGNNAIVSSNATSLSGVVSEVKIIDSGFGYDQDEVLTFTSQSNSSIVFSGTANLLNQGKSRGFWEDNAGKLNSNKYLHDNDYYQEYSYEIQTDISIDRYADVLKNLIHVAGTKMFGSVVKQSKMDVPMMSSGSTITLS